MNRFQLRSRSALAIGASILSLTVGTLCAQDVTLNDGNSVATVNLGGGSGLSGMNGWTINGQSQLNQQWFWFRVGNDPTGQHPLDSLGAPSILSQNANSIDALYTGVGFTIEIAYQLSGGASGGSDWNSDISESISIHNTSLVGSNTFHFFQYSDFALAGGPGGETVNIFQNGSFFSKANVLKGANQLSETIDQPLANHAEAGVTSDSPNTLQRLNSGVPITLNDTLNAGPDLLADGTWALQWDKTLGPGEITDILKDKKLSVAPIPEPASLTLLFGGLLAFGLRRARKVC